MIFIVELFETSYKKYPSILHDLKQVTKKESALILNPVKYLVIDRKKEISKMKVNKFNN